MRFSVIKASLVVAVSCQAVLGQGLTISDVTSLVKQLNKQGLEQIRTVALFDDTTREEYIRDRQGPLTTFSRLLSTMYDSVYGIRRRTQNATPGEAAEQESLASSYLNMTDTHIQMLLAFVDKATTLWTEDGVPPQVGIRLHNYRSGLKNLGNAVLKYAPDNATELWDGAAALDKGFATMDEAIDRD